MTPASTAWPERLGRGDRVERQRQDHARASSASTVSMSLLCLAASKPASVVATTSMPALGELVGRAGGDRVDEVRRGVPEQRGLVALVLQLRDIGIAQRHARRSASAALALRSDRLGGGHARTARSARRQRPPAIMLLISILQSPVPAVV